MHSPLVGPATWHGEMLVREDAHRVEIEAEMPEIHHYEMVVDQFIRYMRLGYRTTWVGHD